MLNQEFFDVAEELRDPLTGTEMMAPLLYYLIRSNRAMNVLEYGTGYSTLFILKALSDNLLDFNSEIKDLKAKKSSYQPAISPEEFDEWFFDKSAPFYDPAYYMRGYKPKLICFEKLPPSHEYTQKLLTIVDKLKLTPFLMLIQGEPCGQSEKIPKEYLPIDLAWNDDDSYYKFFNEYWDLLNENNGALLYHNTISATSLVVSELEKIKIKLESIKEYEWINIVEPHKLHQRSFTMIKKRPKSQSIHFDQPNHQKAIYSSFLDFLEQA